MSSPEERLCQALMNRNLEECNKLINSGIGLENVLENLFKKKFINTDDTDIDGNTLLHFAQKLHFSLTEELLKFGVDINAKNSENKTVFCLLLENDNYDNKLADIYLSAGADINVQKNFNKDTYLHEFLEEKKFFFRQDNFKKVKFLLEKGADVNLKNKCNQLPFNYFLDSCYENRSQQDIRIFEEMVKLLIKYGVDINELDYRNETPLIQVLKDGQTLEFIQVLIDNGADLFKRDYKNNTALHFADDEDTIKFLLSKGLDPIAKNDNGDTPLHHSSVRIWDGPELCFLAHNNRFKMLIDKYDDVNLKNEQGDTILHNLLNFADGVDNEYIYLNEILTLLDKGANINAENNCKETPLHMAFKDYPPIKSVVKFLVNKGAHINSETNEGKTPLHLAIDIYCKYENQIHNNSCKKEEEKAIKYVEICRESIQILLDNGAEVDDDTKHKLSYRYFLL